MQDRIQFKDVKNEFAKFGTFLIIFGSVLIIQNIIAITENILLFRNLLGNVNVILMDIIVWILLIVEIIFFILMVYKLNKISNLAKGPKSNRMFSFFLIWLIFYLIMILINLSFFIMSFLNAPFNIFYDFIIINYIVGVLTTIFQLISWIFMYSFVLNTHGIFPEKGKNQFLEYLIVIMIFTSILIFYYSISWSMSFSYTGTIPFKYILILILPDLVNILIFIGYLLLGSHLIKQKSSITQNIDSIGRNEDLNIEPKMVNISPKKSFCRNCGAKIEPGMSFCTECGKPID